MKIVYEKQCVSKTEESALILMNRLLLPCLLLLLSSSMAFAKEWVVQPADNLQQVLDTSVEGDRVLLQPGRYVGNFIINNPISVIGQPDVIIDAQGSGHALELKSTHIVLDGLTIVNWGDDLTNQDAGIYSDKNSSNIVIQNSYLQGDGFGIWLQGGSNSQVINNTVIGNPDLRSSDRGNGIQISNMKDSFVRDNNISYTRDGLYVIASKDSVLENNVMHDLRYGIHYMYSYTNKILYNHAYNTRAGYAMMNSRHLEIRGNTTIDSEDYGFLMNYIIYSTVDGNIIKNVWTDPEKKVLGRDGKALFIYNSGYNTISNNYIEHAEIGIHLTAGSEGIKIFGNSFIDNPTQVKYVSNSEQEWSQDGVGNYWSNYHGWDMDGNGKGDMPFEPNDGIDKLFWKYPEAKILMDSPAVLLLRWVQRQFPVLKAPGVKDSHPLMKTALSGEIKMDAKNESSDNKDELLLGLVPGGEVK